VLFWRAIQLSLSSERWTKVTYLPERKGVERQSAEITGDAESTIQRHLTNRSVCRSCEKIVEQTPCSGYVDQFIDKAQHPSI
jgi:hypothetical protein